MLEITASVKFSDPAGTALVEPAEHVWSDVSMKDVNKMEKGLIDILKKLNTFSTEKEAGTGPKEVGSTRSKVKGVVDFELTITKDGELFSWSAFKWPNIGNKEFEFMSGMLDGAFSKQGRAMKKAKVK